MTRDDVIAIAHRTCTTYAHLERVKYGFTNVELLQFAKAVAAREREACAEVCAGLYHAGHHPMLRQGAANCAASILARSEAPQTVIAP